MKQNVLNLEGKAAGSIELSDAIYGIEPRADILHRVVVWQEAKARSGNHATKTISDISGTTKKPFKQKKTGRARQGSMYNPHQRGGAAPVAAPHPHSHATDLPKKIRALGLKMALSSKAKSGNLIVLDSEKMTAAKSGALAKSLKNLKITKALFVGSDSVDGNFKKSAANIKNIDVLPTIGLNVKDILGHEHLVLTKDSVAAIEKRLGA
ncbi:MAG: 50S ribosomal protein L4 [Rickettsiales bacterium]|jgi:large subunit ribosomal protein L4|nr:50S ribosomal protein L4 [Rickettsiales bacterium]